MRVLRIDMMNAHFSPAKVKIQGRNFNDVVNDALHREYEHIKQTANFVD
ncbi:MAG: hypothetical protein IJP96_00375 [Synergistaceae bacterium]|nr:hypothetical protein [Synergistaceae bacterium]